MQFRVGKVEKIVLGKVQRVCACCSLRVENCKCVHLQEIFDTTCPYCKIGV